MRAYSCLCRVSLILLLLAVSGCAAPTMKRVQVDPELEEAEAQKQREFVLQTRLKNQSRLDLVAYRIEVSTAHLCGENAMRTLAIWGASENDFEDEWRKAARSVLGLTQAVTVIGVVPNSSAERAGIKAGDVLRKLNFKPVPTGNKATEKFFESLDEALESNTSVVLTVLRDGAVHDIRVPGDLLCYFPAYLDVDEQVDAYADGELIVISQGMLRFADTDEELALVFSHELAHNMMGHVEATKQNVMVGGLLGAIIDLTAAVGGVNTSGAFSKWGGDIGGRAYSQEFEAEADYVGLYMMALAGYDISNAPNFWRRMATVNPKSINYARTHPTAPYRFLALEKTVAEIEEKRIANLPLVPEEGPPITAGAQPASGGKRGITKSRY